MSDQYIKEASALLEQAKGALSGGAGKVQELAGNPDVQKLLPYLLAGGAGAVGGAALSGQRRKRTGETRGQYLTRILRNAAVAGGLVGGGSYLAGEGFKKTLGSVDLEHPMTGGKDDQNPIGSTGKEIAFSPVMAALSGATTLGVTANRPIIGANPGLADAESKLLAGLKKLHGGSLPQGADSKSALEFTAKTDNAALQKLLGDAATPEGKALRLEAKKLGLNVHDASKTINIPGLNRAVSPRHLAHEVAAPFSKVMGRTAGRRIGRAGVGAAGALIPAIIGAILTSKSE
jgi:hypothetical protein